MTVPCFLGVSHKQSPRQMFICKLDPRKQRSEDRDREVYSRMLCLAGHRSGRLMLVLLRGADEGHLRTTAPESKRIKRVSLENGPTSYACVNGFPRDPRSGGPKQAVNASWARRCPQYLVEAGQSLCRPGCHTEAGLRRFEMALRRVTYRTGGEQRSRP